MSGSAPDEPFQRAREVTPTTQGDEPAVERAESLRLPANRWALLWGLPIVAAIVIFVVLVHLAG